MDCSEQQQEELEVLRSIYEGDDNFKEISSTTFQYKVEHENSNKCFLIEITWGDNYPEDKPQISLDLFFNKHLSEEVKHIITHAVETESESWLGSAMTYTLLEFCKENVDEFMSSQCDTLAPVMANISISESASQGGEPLCEKKPTEKKVHLSKSQKRKLADRLDSKGELPRGHDWVDIIKHLSQTGYQKSANATS